MSQWATLEARFESGNITDAESVKQDMPTGSESGPSVYEDNGTVYVHGRLRDVSDNQSPKVLAWFLSVTEFCNSGDLLWDVDDGPRYRYESRNGVLTKLKGVLDS